MRSGSFRIRALAETYEDRKSVKAQIGNGHGYLGSSQNGYSRQIFDSELVLLRDAGVCFAGLLRRGERSGGGQCRGRPARDPKAGCLRHSAARLSY
jgi:hypothetical protein